MNNEQLDAKSEMRLEVLFVCMGNICRSPTAQGVFRKLLETEGLQAVIGTDSAGTHTYHAGEPPDRRAREVALRRGIELGDLCARLVAPEDFPRFEYLLAMDQENLSNLSERCPRGLEHKVKLFMGFAPHLRIREVPDPYYGGAGDFERVFELVEAASVGLLADIRQRFL